MHSISASLHWQVNRGPNELLPPCLTPPINPVALPWGVNFLPPKDWFAAKIGSKSTVVRRTSCCFPCVAEGSERDLLDGRWLGSDFRSKSILRWAESSCLTVAPPNLWEVWGREAIIHLAHGLAKLAIVVRMHMLPTNRVFCLLKRWRHGNYAACSFLLECG